MQTDPALRQHHSPSFTPSQPIVRERILVRMLLGVIVLAVLLRLAAALYMGNAVESLPGIFDQISYDTLARQVAAGRGFTFPEAWWPMTQAGAPTAHWSFLYTLYLAAIYAVGGSPLVARLLQVVAVGVLQPWLTWRIGRRLFDPTVGLVAAGLVAIYAYFVYYSAALMTESFYIVGILWVLDLATGWGRTYDATETEGIDRFGRALRSPWLWLGVALGVTVLLRQVFLLFVPVLFVWLLWSRMRRTSGGIDVHRIRRTFIGLIVAGIVMMAFILPWTYRNYRAFDRFVLLNTNAGYAFFWGNHPIYGTNFVGILPEDGPSYQDLIPAQYRSLDEAALDRALLREGMGFVTSDPRRYLLLSLSRTVEYFKFWPSAESSRMSNVARVFSFGVFLPFMLYGLMVTVGRRPWTSVHSRQWGVTLLYLFVFLYTGVHLLSWALIRYRLPVDALLVVFAAVGICSVADWLVSGYLHGAIRGKDGVLEPK